MTECRTCKSERLYLFLELGDHPLANGFLRADQLAEPEARFPLDVHVCLDCGLIQVADQVPAEYFRHYVYIPSASDVMQEHFARLAEVIRDRLLGAPDALTIDIGCNDGLLLSFLQRDGARTLGIDPASNIAELARERGVEVVNEYFTPELARAVRAEHGPAAVVVTDETVADPVVQELLTRTVVHQDTELFEQAKGSMPGRVTVRTRDGRELTGEVLHPSGSPGNPLTEDQFKAKYLDMAERVLGHDQADELYQRARDLRRIRDVADIAPLLSPK